MKLTKKQMAYLRANAEITIECLPEDTAIKGNALASGNPWEDKECEESIIKQLMRGNEWAWCCVKITARWKQWEGTDYLGCCSYKSEKDFIDCNDYYPDMVARAQDELIEAVESALEDFKSLLKTA